MPQFYDRRFPSLPFVRLLEYAEKDLLKRPEYKNLYEVWQSESRDLLTDGFAQKQYLNTLIFRRGQSEKQYNQSISQSNNPVLERWLKFVHSWESLLPSVEEICNLGTLMSFSTYVPKMAAIQRRFKIAESWTTMSDVLIQKQVDTGWHLSVTQCKMQDEHFMGIWGNGMDLQMLKWYLYVAQVPVFWLHWRAPDSDEELPSDILKFMNLIEGTAMSSYLADAQNLKIMNAAEPPLIASDPVPATNTPKTGLMDLSCYMSALELGVKRIVLEINDEDEDDEIEIVSGPVKKTRKAEEEEERKAKEEEERKAKEEEEQKVKEEETEVHFSGLELEDAVDCSGTALITSVDGDAIQVVAEQLEDLCLTLLETVEDHASDGAMDLTSLVNAGMDKGVVGQQPESAEDHILSQSDSTDCSESGADLTSVNEGGFAKQQSVVQMVSQLSNTSVSLTTATVESVTLKRPGESQSFENPKHPRFDPGLNPNNHPSRPPLKFTISKHPTAFLVVKGRNEQNIFSFIQFVEQYTPTSTTDDAKAAKKYLLDPRNVQKCQVQYILGLDWHGLYPDKEVEKSASDANWVRLDATHCPADHLLMLIGINVLVLSGMDGADKHLRMVYRFSILEIVKDNPKDKTVHFGGIKGQAIRQCYMEMSYDTTDKDGHIKTPPLRRHSYSQIALVVTKKAAFEDMRAKGFVQTDCAFAGHSLSESSALASIANVLAISALVDIVFYCEIMMQHAVERDSENRSNYTMCAVNPSRISKSFSDAALWEVVESISQLTGTLLEIVNYNVEGQQYVCAGELVALQTMANVLNYLKVKKIDITKSRKCLETLSKSVTVIPLPGIDIPFHSRYLWAGVMPFRTYLSKKIDPTHLNPDVLIGNYIPNLIAKPFDVSREYAQIIYDQTSSPRLGKVLRKWDEDKWGQLRNASSWCTSSLLSYWLISLCHLFARFKRRISSLQNSTLNGSSNSVLLQLSLAWQLICSRPSTRCRTAVFLLPGKSSATLNIRRRFITCLRMTASAASEPEVEAPVAASAPVASTPAPVTVTAPVGASGLAASIEDVPIKSSNILIAIVSQKLKKPVSKISMSKSIKDLVGGKSTLQNEILDNLQQEFSSAPEKGEELPLEELGPALGSGHSGALGKYTTGLISRLIGGTSFEIVGLGPLRADGVLLLGTTMEPAKWLGSEAEAKAWLDGVTTVYAQCSGISLVAPGAAGGGGGGGGGAEQERFTMHYFKRDSCSGEIAFDAEKANSAALQAKLDSIAKEHGNLQPVFDPLKACYFDLSWNWFGQQLIHNTCQVIGQPPVYKDVTFPAAPHTEVTRVKLFIWRSCVRTFANWRPTWKKWLEVIRSRSQSEISDDQKNRIKALYEGVVCSLRTKGAEPRPRTPQSRRSSLQFLRPQVSGIATVSADKVPLLHLKRKVGTNWEYSSNLTSVYLDILHKIATAGTTFKVKNALLTRVGKGSIGIEVVKGLFSGGVHIVITTSRHNRSTVEYYQSIFQTFGSRGSALTVVPFNQDLKQDMEALVILPLSPNHGLFGNDSLYSNSKISLETLFQHWTSESWGEYLSLTGAVIGWTRGTTLMGPRNIVAHKLKSYGIRTFSEKEMAFNILGLMHPLLFSITQVEPIWADLNGGMDRLPDLAEITTRIQSSLMKESDLRCAIAHDNATDYKILNRVDTECLIQTVDVLPRANFRFKFPDLETQETLINVTKLCDLIDLEKVMVITGSGEAGPWGAIEMAWMMGYIKHFDGRLKDGSLSIFIVPTLYSLSKLLVTPSCQARPRSWLPEVLMISIKKVLMSLLWAAMEMSRPTASTHAGFMEAQGSGMHIVMSVKTALELDCLVRCILGFTSTSTDKAGRSVPVPGRGPLTDEIEAQKASGETVDKEYYLSRVAAIKQEAARQEKEALATYRMLEGSDPHIAPLRQALAVWGLTIDGINVLSIHSTSTQANIILQLNLYILLLLMSQTGGERDSFLELDFQEPWLNSG
ncbi:hypothetical protein BT96DRAFT_996816 [Gymnopus androsaceus JB14]|uniref:Carrier domain-containing protein n=1 Tax=Gymnopus androsaceus JB14 TaxID=1447944 RepID=A0A6A4HEP1_9AGAR|nr:hypothetical protein BT96DRAFT_996816 [Gymnopus androsaceus JB14]